MEVKVGWGSGGGIEVKGKDVTKFGSVVHGVAKYYSGK